MKEAGLKILPEAVASLFSLTLSLEILPPSLPASQPDLKFFTIGASWELAHSVFKTVISTFLGIKKQAIWIVLLDAKFEKAHNTLIFQDNECLQVDPWSYSNTANKLCSLASQEALFS